MNKTIRTHTETETDAADVERHESTDTVDEQADATVPKDDLRAEDTGSDETGTDTEGETVRFDKDRTSTPSSSKKNRKQAGAAEVAGSDEPPDQGGSRRNRIASRARKVAIPVLAVLAVAGLVGTGILGWQVKQQADKDAAAEAGLAAARDYAVALTSVDSNTLDQDFAAVLDGSTGEFKDMYTRSSGQLRQLLMDNKATGEGTVLDAAVKSATTDKVEVLLFIDQTVTNAASPDPRVDRSRVAMTMDLVDGRWLASRVYLP